jgi:hypothetical protein
MRTITAQKYEDENGIDFATNSVQKAEFHEMVQEMNRQTGEDWSTYLSEVEVEQDEDGNITYNGSVFRPAESKGEGHYVAI